MLALQCHAEMGLDPRIEAWIDQSHDSLAEVGIEPETLRAQYAAIGPAAVEAGEKMIRQWLCSID